MTRAYKIHKKASTAFKTYNSPSEKKTATMAHPALAMTPALTKAHSVTAKVDNIAKRDEITGQATVIQPQIVFYTETSSVDVQGPKSSIPKAQKGGGKRRPIGQFSKGSRRRFRRQLSKIKIEELAKGLFVSLTYPQDAVQAADWEVYKEHKSQFIRQLTHRYPESSGVWILEFQRNGAPHYHFLVFGLRHLDLEELRPWVKDTWYKIAHNGDPLFGEAGTHVEWVRHGGSIIGYMSKLASKSPPGIKYLYVGKRWDRFASANLPIGVQKIKMLTEEQHRKIIRWARKKLESDTNNSRWKRFLDGRFSSRRSRSGIQPSKIPAAIGGRMLWEKGKAAFHGGADKFNFFTILPAGEYNGYPYGSRRYSITLSTELIKQYRPPSKWKMRNTNRLHVTCNSDSFMAAIERAAEQGLLGP